MVLVVVMAAARRAFRVENHLRINNHNNLFYGRCRISAILRYYSPTKFLSIYCGLLGLTMEMGKGLIVAMVIAILAHLQLQLVW